VYIFQHFFLIGKNIKNALKWIFSLQRQGRWAGFLGGKFIHRGGGKSIFEKYTPPSSGGASAHDPGDYMTCGSIYLMFTTKTGNGV